jgi:hypothetical protein
MCPGRIAAEAAHLAGTAFSELIPPEAQAHLIKAQAELYLAVKATIEHHARHVQSEERRARRGSRRPVKIEVD